MLPYQQMPRILLATAVLIFVTIALNFCSPQHQIITKQSISHSLPIQPVQSDQSQIIHHMPYTHHTNFINPALSISPDQLNRLNQWLAETGIPSELTLDTQGRLTASDPLSRYKERTLDQLRMLTKQGDRKAQLALSHLLMEKHAAHFSNDNPAVQEAQRNIEGLAVYGNTHSILQLAALYLSSADRLVHKEGQITQQADTDSIRNFYKYIYFAQKRGAQDVSQFEDLQKYSQTIGSLPNIEDIKRQAFDDADALYQQLAKIRAEQGLPPFDNQQPHEIARILQQVTSFASS